MPRDALVNPVVLATLGALLERPMHAYQLTGVLAGRGVPVNRGSLYDTLDATTRAGWTESQPAERAGARARARQADRGGYLGEQHGHRAAFLTRGASLGAQRRRGRCERRVA